MYTDITRQKQAQAQTELARNRLDDAIQSISDGFALWDREDRLIAFNNRCRELLKLPDGFVLGTRFDDLIRKLASRRARDVHEAETPEAWIEQQLAAHRNASGDEELQLEDGTW